MMHAIRDQRTQTYWLQLDLQKSPEGFPIPQGITLTLSGGVQVVHLAKDLRSIGGFFRAAIDFLTRRKESELHLEEDGLEGDQLRFLVDWARNPSCLLSEKRISVLIRLYMIAERFTLQRFQKECGQWLVALLYSDAAHAEDFLTLLHYDLDALGLFECRELCINWLIAHFQQVYLLPEFLFIGRPYLKAAMECNFVNIDSEADLYEALKKWAQANKGKEDELILSNPDALIREIRFENMRLSKKAVFPKTLEIASSNFRFKRHPRPLLAISAGINSYHFSLYRPRGKLIDEQIAAYTIGERFSKRWAKENPVNSISAWKCKCNDPLLDNKLTISLNREDVKISIIIDGEPAKVSSENLLEQNNKKLFWVRCDIPRSTAAYVHIKIDIVI